MDETEIEFKNSRNEKIKIKCEIAKTLYQKTKGLMHREDLDLNKGMLFIFTLPWIRIFWMKNVKIPLDIIFIISFCFLARSCAVTFFKIIPSHL